jgi:dihydrolipoamide dehydrogenase
VTFTDPIVASVGETAAQVAARGGAAETVQYDIGQVAGAALTRDDYTGRAHLVIDPSTDTLLGATFVGPNVGEIVHAATIAIAGKVPIGVLWHAVPSYPTVSEIWLRLLETLAEQRARR